MSEKLEIFLKNYLVPPLPFNIGEYSITEDNFKRIRVDFEEEYAALFDCIQQNADIFDRSEDYLEAKTILILVLAEHTAKGTAFYTTRNEGYFTHMESVFEKRLKSVDKKVVERLFSKYQNVLTSKSWKVEIATVNGYVNFVEKYFSNQNLMTSQWITLSLTVGLNLLDLHEIEFKSMGILLLRKILFDGNKEMIQSANIHNLIFSEFTGKSYYIDNEAQILEMFMCSTRCLDLTDSKWKKWDKPDILLDKLIDKIRFSSSVGFCTDLLEFLYKICIRDCKNIENLREFFERNKYGFQNPDELREAWKICSKIDAHIIYRWSKTIFYVLNDVTTFLNTTNMEKAQHLLHMMTICYLTCLYPIPVNLNESLISMIRKTLRKIIKSMHVHRKNEYFNSYLQSIFYFFQTIDHHINSNNSNITPNFKNISENIQKTLQFTIFNEFQIIKLRN